MRGLTVISHSNSSRSNGRSRRNSQAHCTQCSEVFFCHILEQKVQAFREPPLPVGIGFLMGAYAIAGNRLHHQGIRLNGHPLGRSRVLVAGNTLALHPALESIPPRTILRTKTSRVQEPADVLAPANVPIVFMTLGSWTNKSDFRLWRHGVGVVGG